MKDYVAMYEKREKKCLEKARRQSKSKSESLHLSQKLFQQTATDDEIAGRYLKVCKNPGVAFTRFDQDSKKIDFAFQKNEKSIKKILNDVLQVTNMRVTNIIEFARREHLTADDLVSEAECVEEYGEWYHRHLMGYNPEILREAAEILYKEDATDGLSEGIEDASKGNCSNGSKQLWARVGMSFDLTGEEYQRFMELKDDPGIDDYVTSLIQEGKARLDGEAYFPEGCNDNPEQDVEMELSGELFDDSKVKESTKEDPDPLMEFISKEVPWRLKEIYSVELSNERIEELVDVIKNNTDTMFDYDKFDNYILNEVNRILHDSEPAAKVKNPTSEEKYHVLCNLYYQMDNDSMVIGEAELNLKRLNGVDEKSISVIIAEDRDAESEEFPADKNYWMIADFKIYGDEKSIRKEIEDVMGFMSVDVIEIEPVKELGEKMESSDVINNLINAMADYAQESNWTDQDFVEALVDCGLSEADFEAFGYEEYAKQYFEKSNTETTDPQTTMYVLLEEYTNESGIVETTVLGISPDKNVVRKMMRNRIQEDENDVIARNGVEEDDEDYFSTNTVDGEYVKYSITEMPVSAAGMQPQKIEIDLGFGSLSTEKMYVLVEEYEDKDRICEFTVLGVSTDETSLRKMMRNRIQEDPYGVIEKNGIGDNEDNYFCTEIDGGYIKYSIIEMPVLNSKPADKLEMDLGFATLVAKKGTDPNYSEIFVGLEDKKGVWSQDLAVIGEKYHYENDEIVREGRISLKVYSDKDSEDYTQDFDIEAYKEYPILSACIGGEKILATFDDEMLSAFEKTLQDWADDKIVIDEDSSEYQHIEDELFFSDIIRWNVGEITTDELIESYQEVQEDIKGLVSDAPENGKCEKEMGLKEFLSYFDFDYDIVSPGSAYEQRIRQERLEDGDLSPKDMDKDLIYLIDKQGVYLGEIYKERYPIAAESVEKIVERMDVYIQDSVIDEFEEALKNRNIDTSDLSLEKMIKKCKELGEDEVCYRLAEVIVHPELIYIAELATNNVDETSVEDVAKLLSEKHPEYANQIYQMMNAYKNPIERACDKEAVMRLKDYKKVDPTVDEFEDMVNALSYDFYNSAEFLNTSSEEADDLTWQTLQQFSVWIDDDDSENDFYQSLKEKKNPLIDLKDTQEIVATVVCRILSGEVEEYPMDEPLEITDADVEKVEERFYALDKEFVSLNDLLKIAKKELI